jgi:hypothetical protein
MGDRQNAARVAWATIKLSRVGQRPVSLGQLATQVGLPAGETARLLHLTWQERIDLQAASRWLAEHPKGRLIPVRSFHGEARRLVDRLEAVPPAIPDDMNAAGGDRA